MAKRTIRVSSRAMGRRDAVTVYVYDTVEELREAARAYNGGELSDALGVTQVRCNSTGRAVSVIVRLARGRLNTQIVGHEIHHAATAWYGARMADRISRTAHLNHHNEPFAHLFSDLMTRLVDRLYELGYYA